MTTPQFRRHSAYYAVSGCGLPLPAAAGRTLHLQAELLVPLTAIPALTLGLVEGLRVLRTLVPRGIDRDDIAATVAGSERRRLLVTAVLQLLVQAPAEPDRQLLGVIEEEFDELFPRRAILHLVEQAVQTACDPVKTLDSALLAIVDLGDLVASKTDPLTRDLDRRERVDDDLAASVHQPVHHAVEIESEAGLPLLIELHERPAGATVMSDQVGVRVETDPGANHTRVELALDAGRRRDEVDEDELRARLATLGLREDLETGLLGIDLPEHRRKQHAALADIRRFRLERVDRDEARTDTELCRQRATTLLQQVGGESDARGDAAKRNEGVAVDVRHVNSP